MSNGKVILQIFQFSHFSTFFSKFTRYVPGKFELEVAQNLLEKYLQSQLLLLNDWVGGKTELEKEEILRSLKQIHRLIHGCSELLPTIKTGPFCTSFSENLNFLRPLDLTFKNGQHVRQTVLEGN